VENDDLEGGDKKMKASVEMDGEDDTTEEIHNTSIYLQNAYSSYTSCSICIDDLQQGEELILLQHCGHFFHPQCIGPWLTKKRANCPLCQMSVSHNVRQSPQSQSQSQQQSNLFRYIAAGTEVNGAFLDARDILLAESVVAPSSGSSTTRNETVIDGGFTDSATESRSITDNGSGSNRSAVVVTTTTSQSSDEPLSSGEGVVPLLDSNYENGGNSSGDASADGESVGAQSTSDEQQDDNNSTTNDDASIDNNTERCNSISTTNNFNAIEEEDPTLRNSSIPISIHCSPGSYRRL